MSTVPGMIQNLIVMQPILFIRGDKMNLLEHYIIRVLEEEDVTQQYKIHCGEEPKETLIRVFVIVNCHGTVYTDERIFGLSEWEDIVKKGYYVG